MVLLFPVEAMVNAFSRGPRAADVEKAINEVTGLTVSVSAQVGQASGGPATTGPSAQASHPGPAAQPSQPGGWVSEPPPFDEAAAQAAPQGDPEPADAGWPEPVRAPEPVLQPAPEPVDAGWPEPAHAPEPAPEPEPVESGWPEPATVMPIRRDEPVAPAASPVTQEEQPQPTGRPALPERAARALAQAPTEAPEAAQASSPNGDAAPRKRSFTVFRYPGDPEPADEPADAPVQPEPASSPVFDDAPIERAAHTPSTPTGWGDPVVISGGASVNFDDGADSWTPPESAAPADVTPISAAPSAPTPGFGALEPQRDAGRTSDGPLTGRAAAEAALREKAQREAAVVSTRTHAADDDSASIDDENIENSQTIGLAAVLEILGGRVIEEKMTEGGY
ncbi:DNA polymerase III subunits gamma and tau [Mycobacteroides abscessus subsp. abscessus]|nr:DNA polymerase III subunits gamma and tau [Mycobacteroides abscessus subsp. abscessus]